MGIRSGIEKDNGFIEGYGGIDEKPFIIAPEIIASLPGGEAISGDAIGIEEQWVGLRDVRPTPGDIDDSADFFGTGAV